MFIAYSLNLKRVWTFVLLMLGCFLVGCQSETEISNEEMVNQELEAQQDQILDLMGLWQPDQGVRNFEFYWSGIDGLSVPGLQTGRIIENGRVMDLFYWTIDRSGVISMTIVDKFCAIRPINRCPVSKVGSIVVNGDSRNRATWDVLIDTDLDGIVDLEESAVYQRKSFEAGLADTQKFFLVPVNERFDTPILGESTSNQTMISLNYLDAPVGFHWNKNTTPEFAVTLQPVSSYNIVESETYFIDGIGYQELDVKTWYDKVQLHSLTQNNFLLSYEIRREIILPDGISASDVNEDVRQFERHSKIFNLSTSRFTDVTILPGQRFYSFFIDQFDDDLVNGGATNEIVFETETRGQLLYKDLYEDRYTQSKSFVWSRTSDDVVTIEMDDGYKIELIFLKEILGGFSVVQKHIPLDEAPYFYVHDFIQDGSVDNLSDLVPGRFEFLSNNGWQKVLIDFNSDFTIETNAPGVAGYWFINDDGELVGYECLTNANVEVPTYEDCYNRFEDLQSTDSNISFAHIRKLKFLHKNGNKLQAKYDANVWGGPFGIVDQDYMGISWTYRWERVGDAED